MDCTLNEDRRRKRYKPKRGLFTSSCAESSLDSNNEDERWLKVLAKSSQQESDTTILDTHSPQPVKSISEIRSLGIYTENVSSDAERPITQTEQIIRPSDEDVCCIHQTKKSSSQDSPKR
jgi:hypothetical protein